MNSKVALAIIAASFIAVMGASNVYATHTYINGVTQTSSQGLYDAKATAERVNEYQWDRTDANGNYQLTTSSTNSYTVDSTKQGFTRDRDTVNGGQTAPTQSVGPRFYTDTKWKVAYDTSTSVTLAEARNYLLQGEPWFRDEHSIDFIETTASEAWTSSGATATCAGFLTHMNSDTGWTGGDYGGADIMAGFVDGGFTDAIGCIPAPVPTQGGQHPYYVINVAQSADIARSVMHETTHAYGFNHTLSCDNQIPGIMATNSNNGSCSSSIYIKNWTPTDDNTMEARRSWY